jgi:hypothetical protein
MNRSDFINRCNLSRLRNPLRLTTEELELAQGKAEQQMLGACCLLVVGLLLAAAGLVAIIVRSLHLAVVQLRRALGLLLQPLSQHRAKVQLSRFH